MKKKVLGKKMILKKTTVSNLNREEQNQVNGGGSSPNTQCGDTLPLIGCPTNPPDTFPVC